MEQHATAQEPAEQCPEAVENGAGITEEMSREMVEDITRLGIRTAVLLRGVMLQKVDQETLRWGLDELGVEDLMARYIGPLLNVPDHVQLLNLLYLVYGLHGQIDYQIREYGLDSLKDDLQEINFSLQQIGEQFRLEELKVAI